ncbi:SMI1/KNR4 family protein [Paractinoplanes deccanensis]|uniref:SMI1/KNR4 family protein n=1 Tax=Paractinoplanes deccanensis TaxID=113561 RepID=A0ABQ3Y7K9_9ACTN|nr:SMI1/KNR4 family protein [Actinoplanes deccanensis]GID75982.1 SMI1/KNR4 family protein [Actinoplanes deccanensis]
MVDWVDGAIDDPQPASDTAVRQAQDELEVRLPPDFLAVAQIHQGAAPVPAGIDLPNGFGTAVDHLLHFEDSPFVSNIVAAIFPLLDVLDEGIIPFAADVGGDFFCFDYRADDDQPSVVFWSVDWGIVPLAPDFAGFLGMLRP